MTLNCASRSGLSAPSRVLLLACRLNFCFFSNLPTTVWLILCPSLSKFSRQPAQALARPAQRRHRIAARVGLDQPVQIVEQTGGRFGQRFASPSRTTNATERQQRRRVEFLQAASDRARGDPRDARNPGYAAVPRRPGLRRQKPSLPFIQLRQYRCIALLQLPERI